MLILKFMTSQLGRQTIAIHIIPKISRNKGNLKMKFGQLIEFNMRNIFLEKSCTKCGGENIPRHFYKKSKQAYLWINSVAHGHDQISIRMLQICDKAICKSLT